MSNDAFGSSPPRTVFRVPKAAELVARALRSQIIRGELKEGGSLPHEGDLVERFGVSRPTLREAVRILESEGLISISRGSRGGAKIHSPDAAVAARYFGLILQSRGVTIADVYRARMVIEPPAAEIVARERGPEVVDVLTDLIERSREAIDDNLVYGDLSAGFYRTLVELSGIQTLGLLNGLLHDVLARSNARTWSSPESRKDPRFTKEASIKAREKLVSLIAARKAKEAGEYTRVNLQAIIDIITEWNAAGRIVDVLEDWL